MSRFVVDCSVTMAWCFENQSDGYTRGILSRLEREEASVPSVWPLEVANSLAVAERRKKITRAVTARFIAILGALPVFVEEDTHRRALGTILAIAREQSLSTYDAAYLELALREGLPLATRDQSLRRAARSLGVALVAG